MSGVIHKCPKCKVALVPCVGINIDLDCQQTSISAEKTMHLTDDNYIYWKCPRCLDGYYSEIEVHAYVNYCDYGLTFDHHLLYNYTSKEKALRKRKEGE